MRLLQSIQPGQLSDAEINPFFFRKPVAPLIAARQTNKSIQLTAVLAAIGKTASRCDLLLVEGAGGLLSPLGEGFTAAELIRDLQADVCIVAANKLGTINHTCLTARTVAPFAKKSLTVTLSRTGPKSDASMATNKAIITEMLSPLPVWSLPYVGSRASSAPSIERNARRLSPVWAALFASVQN